MASLRFIPVASHIHPSFFESLARAKLGWGLERGAPSAPAPRPLCGFLLAPSALRDGESERYRVSGASSRASPMLLLTRESLSGVESAPEANLPGAATGLLPWSEVRGSLFVFDTRDGFRDAEKSALLDAAAARAWLAAAGAGAGVESGRMPGAAAAAAPHSAAARSAAAPATFILLV
jgi:uncharacterized membrane protein YgcG